MPDEDVERATYYEAHRNDPDEWDEAEAPRPRRRLASMISVRLSPKEAAVIRQAAERDGVSVSAFLRSAALTAALRPTVGGETGLNAMVARFAASTRSVQIEVSLQAVPHNADTSLLGESGLVQMSALSGTK